MRLRAWITQDQRDWLDVDGRPLGERSSPLYPSDTVEVVCPYSGARRGRPMNETARLQVLANRDAGLATLVFLLIEAGACAATGLLPGGNPSPRSFNDLRAAAEKGDAIAQRLVANAYLTGEGVKQDPTEGVKWVKLAADQRDPYAQYTLGILYDEGTALPRNLKEAVKWYSLAAAQGLPDAQFNLAICYSKGEGVERDLKLAAGWFRKAAEQGDALSQFHLGLAYISSKGVERNHAEATSWLRKAAYQEVPAAQFYLGRLYQEGEGVAPEADTAVK